MSPPLRRWSSFHLHLPGSHARFLAEHLAPWLDGTAASYRRFFYLRHADGGLHLRLRFLPEGERVAGGLRDGLAACADAYLAALGRSAGPSGPGGPGGGYRLEEHLYDRSELYFGDTPASVYAELLNEASSWLALQLLRSPGAQRRAHRWLLLAGSLDALLRRSARSDDDRLRALEESRAFAERLVAQTGGSEVDPGVRAGRAVRRAVPRVAVALADDAVARRLARLLRWTRSRCPHGRFVATHALHLFANKLGFSVTEECLAFAALGDLAAPPPPAGPTAGTPAAQADARAGSAT